ncbi:MAG: DUF5667 domain-containing protein [Candidatus Buchananbacteria bacterium]
MSDQQTINSLKALKNSPQGGQVNADWVLRNKEVLMSQICAQSEVNIVTINSSTFSLYQKVITQFIFSRQVFQPAIGVLSILLAVFGVSALTKVSADSLPGDWLFPLKMTNEKVQLAFTSDQEKKVQMQLQFISNRAQELTFVSQQTASDQKSGNIQTAAQNLVNEMQNIGGSLDKVSKTSTSANTVILAKAVDSQTSDVSKTITAAGAQLSPELKQQVEASLKQALSATDNTNVRALTVIVEKHQAGQSEISSDEVAQLVNDKIKSTQEKLQVMQQQVNSLATTSIPVIMPITASSTQATTTELTNFPKAAQKTLDAAGQAVSQQNFSEALSKLGETNDLLTTVETKVQAVTSAIVTLVPTTTATTTKP